MTYGLPAESNIVYGGAGFPEWVYELAAAFSLEASTYPGHQESDRAPEPGYAPNPQRLNRGIDFAGPTDLMDSLARYLLSIRDNLEQVIWQHPKTGTRIGVAGGKDVSATPYFASEFQNHRDHVHLRTSQPIPKPNQETAVGWTGDPVWLADVLRAQKPALKVRELPDWQQYGHGDMRSIWGVMLHHTGNAKESAESIRRGRPDLPGPLSQLHIAQDGTVTVVAAGVCWHAGMGSHPGIPTDLANYHLIGIECAWPRDTSITPATQTRERWPDSQIIAMRDTCAAILTRLGVGPDRVIGHKDWAGKSQGKWDPANIELDPWFRGEVAKAQAGGFITADIKPTLTDRQLLELIYADLQGLKSR